MSPSKELDTIQPYEPPYWEERAWNPDGRPQWEQKALAALEHSSVDMLETLLTRRERAERWAKPYGKSRAFALDYTADIIAGVRHTFPAEAPQTLFADWQTERDWIMGQFPVYEATVETAQIQTVQP